jgi:hypothetical protein
MLVGLSLLNIAAQEDEKRPSSSGASPASLSRQLYVHGVTYMLRGLPTDLSANEKLSIWSSIPPDVQQVSPIADGALVVVHPSQRQIETGAKSEKSSALQYIVASFIVQLFVLTQFLLPYIKYCFAILYKYERRHRISERVLATTVRSCEGMMKTGLQVSNAICKMNDGKVGQTLNELSISWISGLTAGVHQGVGDGLSMLAAKESPPEVDGKKKG